MIEWLRWAFSKKDTISLSESFEITGTELAYKKLALSVVISLIAKTFASVEFKTYEKGKQIKKDNYYLFNIEPNPNQNATEFWSKVLFYLYSRNEALIIEKNGYLYIADSFATENKTIYKTTFKDVVVGDLEFKTSFSSSDVFYLKCNNENIKNLVDSVYATYGQMVSLTLKNYKRKVGKKVKFDIGALGSQLEKDLEARTKFVREKLKDYFEKEDSAIPIEQGFKFEELPNNTEGSSKEFNDTVDKVLDLVAFAFNVPKNLLKGDIADIEKQTNNFITFVIKPIAELIENEINRKYYKKENYLNGSYVKLDISKINYSGIFDVAGSLDILTRIGFSPNELRETIDYDTVNEDWANKHYITKNYSDADSLEGGEEGEK